MARVLTAAVVAELIAARSRPVYFVEAEFSSGIVNFWSGLGSIVFDGKTWEGVGKLGGISVVDETSQLRAGNLVLSLSGLPASILTNVLDEIRFGKEATVQMGYLTEAGAVIADPFFYFKGIIDKGQIDEAGETSTAQVNVESELGPLQRAKEFRYTSEDQKAEFPTDEGFDHVTSVAEPNLVWGRSTGSIPQIPVHPPAPSPGPGCVLEGTDLEPLGNILHVTEKENENWLEIGLEDGRHLTATPDHPIYTDRGKIRLQQTLIGDAVVTKDGIALVNRIETRRLSAKKLIVNMERGHLFWANGILSHNKLAGPL